MGNQSNKTARVRCEENRIEEESDVQGMTGKEAESCFQILPSKLPNAAVRLRERGESAAAAMAAAVAATRGLINTESTAFSE